MNAPDTALLDNPIWNALRTGHADIAQGDDHARRYPPDIGPLSGIPDQSPENYDVLRSLAGDGIVALFSLDPFRIPDDWKTVRSGALLQMIRPTPIPNPVGSPGFAVETRESTKLRQLTSTDAQAMVELAELTEPGPFRLRTLELGNFYGIFHGERLVSMAGKRMHLPGLIEVSGVCTHPDARGRGYAGQLMSLVIDEIERDGKIPVLHAFTTNPAIRLYESLGFQLRQNLNFAVLAKLD